MSPHKPKLNKHFLFSLVIAIGIGFFVSSIYALAADWAAPTATPPTCPASNPACYPPINTGSSTQYKSGGLGVGGVFEPNNIITTGNNTYSTTSTTGSLDADIVIGSNQGVRHDSSIMFWSTSSAARILENYGSWDRFYLSPWNQDAITGAGVALSATVGGKSYFLGNLGINTSNPSQALSIYNGNIDLMRETGNSVTPGMGPQIILESPSAGVTTQETSRTQCGGSGQASCPSDNTPAGSSSSFYACPSGSRRRQLFPRHRTDPGRQPVLRKKHCLYLGNLPVFHGNQCRHFGIHGQWRHYRDDHGPGWTHFPWNRQRCRLHDQREQLQYEQWLCRFQRKLGEQRQLGHRSCDRSDRQYHPDRKQ